MKNVIVSIGSDLGILGNLPTGIHGEAYSATIVAYGADIISIEMLSETSADTFTFTDNGDNTGTLTCAALTDHGLFEVVFRLKDNATRRNRRIPKPLRVAYLPPVLLLAGTPGTAYEGEVYASYDILRTGGTGDITLVSATGLPSGLSAAVDNVYDYISITGTPDWDTLNSYAVVITVQDTTGVLSVWSGTIVVAANPGMQKIINYLYGYWPMQEASGSTVDDAGRWDRDMSSSGSVATRNFCTAFPRGRDYATFTTVEAGANHVDSIRAGDVPISFGGWAERTSAVGTNTLISYSADSDLADTNIQFQGRVNSSNQMSVAWESGTGTGQGETSTTSVISLDTPVFLCWIRDPENLQWRFYIDGVRTGVESYTTPAEMDTYWSTSRLTMGAGSVGPGENKWEGWGAGNFLIFEDIGDEGVRALYKSGEGRSYSEIASQVTPLWLFHDLTTPAKMWCFHKSHKNPTSGAARMWTNWADLVMSGSAVRQPLQTSATNRPAVVWEDGKQVLSFDGNDNFFVIANGSGTIADLNGVSNCWMFTTYYLDANDGTTRYVGGFSTNGNVLRTAILASYAATGGGKPAIFSRQRDADAAAIGVHASTSHVAEKVMVLALFDFANNRMDLYVNGELVDSDTAPWSVGQTQSATNSIRFRIGAAPGPGTADQFFDGTMYCWAHGTNGLPTSTEIDKMFGWAAHEYGCTDKLASDHPYKTAFPTP
jgi:hypothetical protein